MHRLLVLPLILVALTGALAHAQQRDFNACALLTGAQVQAVQGEAVTAQPSVQGEGALQVYQCFYTAPTFSKSVSLQVIQQRAGAGGGRVREFWREKFHVEEERRPAKAGHGEQESEAEKESAPPQRIEGLGEEAFWTSGRVTSALYVLKGSRILRISLGGAEDPEAKIRKSKLLAREALRRF